MFKVISKIIIIIMTIMIMMRIEQVASEMSFPLTIHND